MEDTLCARCHVKWLTCFSLQQVMPVIFFSPHFAAGAQRGEGTYPGSLSHDTLAPRANPGLLHGALSHPVVPCSESVYVQDVCVRLCMCMSVRECDGGAQKGQYLSREPGRKRTKQKA